MPILPQAFWYKVDGKLKQVFFEENKVTDEKRNAIFNKLQKSRLYNGGFCQHPISLQEGQQGEFELESKEKIYGFYPTVPAGTHFLTVTQAKEDKRILKPLEQRAIPVVPADRTREPVSTQIDPNGVIPCVPPYPTDPMAYGWSVENVSQSPTDRPVADFARWELEETGKIPQWNDVVTYHGTASPARLLPDRPQTIAVVNKVDAPNATKEDDGVITPPPVTAEQKRAVSLQPPRTKSSRPSTPTPARPNGYGGSRGGVQVEATPVIAATVKTNVATVGSRTPAPATVHSKTPDSTPSYNKVSIAASTAIDPSNLSLQAIQDMQKQLTSEYRWRFNVPGDPFSVKNRVRPSRPRHWMRANVIEPKKPEKPVRYADSSTYFYNTIPIIPLSFSVGPHLGSEKVIRDREQRQKYAPKSTPNDRFFVPSFVY